MKIYRAIVFLVSIFFSLSFMATAQASSSPEIDQAFKSLVGIINIGNRFNEI